MFLSADFLGIYYGVNDEIANFFVDREPPANNLYWHNKLLYLRQEPGYIFIPVIVDALYRLGIAKKDLLSENYVKLLEDIGHIAALEETGKITEQQAVEQCISLTKHKALNPFYFSELLSYMQGNTNNFIYPLRQPFKALHRGDIFLFTLTVLPIPHEKLEQAVAYWFVIIGSFLMLDDAQDVEADKLTGEANAFLECGLDTQGIERIKSLLNDNLNFIRSFNKPLAKTVDGQFVKMAELPHIKQYLNN